nr:AAC(3) family N-acetyltransferase [Micromonospora matsumotoense]
MPWCCCSASTGRCAPRSTSPSTVAAGPPRDGRTGATSAGGRVRRDFHAPHLDDSDFPLIGAAVVAHGSVRSGPVGSAESHCVRLRHAVDVARGWMDEHRLA